MSELHDHEYMHEHGIEHTHEGEHCHEHSHEDGSGHAHTHGEHTHTHEYKKPVMNRIARSAGHLQSISNMVERGDDCSDILIQLAAVRSEINGICNVILKEHIDHCLVDAAKSGDTESIAELEKAVETLIKFG